MQKVKPDMLSYIVSCSLPHQLFQKCFFCRQKLAGLGAESRHPQGSAWALTKDSKKRRFSHLFLPLLSSLKHPQPFWNQWLVSWKTTFPWIRVGGGMVSGWFKHITFIVHFISIIILSALLRSSSIRSWRLETPAVDDSRHPRQGQCWELQSDRDSSPPAC